MSGFQSRNLDTWLLEYIRILIDSQPFKDGFTLDFLVDSIQFTTIDHEWSSFPIESQKKLIRLKLQQLEKKGEIMLVKDVTGNYYIQV